MSQVPLDDSLLDRPGHSVRPPPDSQERAHNLSFSAADSSVRSRKRARDAEIVDDETAEGEDGNEPKKNPGRRKIDIEYIQDKAKRHITFSKRKAGIMKKAHELATLTGTQLLLLVVSESGVVYTYTTTKLQPIVSEDPGRSLISACLNDGDNKIKIQEDDLEGANEEGDFLPGGGEEECDQPPSSNTGLPTTTNEDKITSVNDLYPPSVQPSNSNCSSFATNNPIYFPDNCHNKPRQSYDSMLPDPVGYNCSNLYENAPQPIGLTPEHPFSIPPGGYSNFGPGPASFLGLAPSQEMSPITGYGSLESFLEEPRLKRRKTEADIRQKSNLSIPLPNLFPGQFSMETQSGWIDTPTLPQLSGMTDIKPAHTEAQCLNDFASNFVLHHSGQLPTSIKQEPVNLAYILSTERAITIFLDACDHYPIRCENPDGRSWRHHLFPSKQVLTGCLQFLFNDYLPLLSSFPIENFSTFCEEMQIFINYLCLFYDQPEQARAEMGDLIQRASSSFRRSSISSSGAGGSHQGLTDHPVVQNQKFKSAPKLKPRKGVNVNLRGGRLESVLEEYTAWCRKNKTSWSGNNPDGHIKGWLKIERVRRTFCCCELVSAAPGLSTVQPSIFKIRFPSSAIKLIRKGDKLELEIQQSDDCLEWNIFNHSDSDLFPGDESEEDEPVQFIMTESPPDESTLESLKESRGMSLEEAKSFLVKRRLIKTQIESGDFEDDGFESKVPPKGGKQAFRVKKPPSASGSKGHLLSYDAGDLSDTVLSSLKNSPQ